jgi:heavy metal efflux system protein
MLERIVTFCLNRKGFILFVTALLVAAGMYAFSVLPIDAFPDVTNVQVEIISNAPGLSPLEIERAVTIPVERAMRGLPGMTQLRSVTKFGLSVVTIVFTDRTDLYFARQQVFERLEEVTRDLPDGVSAEMGPVATAMGEIYQYTLKTELPADSAAKTRRLADLRTLQDQVIAPQLKSVPGVSDINSFGGHFREYQVTVQPERLLARGLTVTDVFDALERNNRNAGGNILDRFAQQRIVRGVGLIASEDDILNIVLASHGGTPVLVRDVAEVRIGEAVRQGAAMLNGTGEVVGGIVMMRIGENGREVTELVKRKVRELAASSLLPPGVSIEPYYDRSDIVHDSIRTVSTALLAGAALVLIVVLILLRSLRGAVVVILALPLSLLATFVVMKAAGLDANLMSLGGLAISIGMIIDATIIQVENVQRRLHESGRGSDTLPVVLRAVLEVRQPSMFGELIIAVTFLPILSLQGLEGKMFGPLALTVAIALLASLLLSMVVIPVLCLLFLRPGFEKESVVIGFIRRRYLPALERGLRHRVLVAGGAVMLLLAAILLLPRLGTEFMPIMDEGAFDMDVQMMPGISLDKSLEMNALAARRLMRFPELSTLLSRTGQTGIAVEARGVEKTGFTGVFRPREEWTTAGDKEELIDSMRSALSTIPGMLVSFSQPIQCRIDELVAGTRAQLIIKVFGEDMETLAGLADRIADVAGRIPGAKDLSVERVAGQSYLSVTIDRGRIARHGLNVSDVLDVLEIAVGGKTATRVYEAGTSFPLTVRFPEERRNSPEAIGEVLIASPQGYNVPLDEVADIRSVEGPAQVSREDGRRRIGIELNIEGRDIGGFVAEAKRAIRNAVPLPSGYSIAWGGQFENQQRAMATLAVIAPLAAALILALLYFTFRSLRLALLVLANLPFALIGGVLALFVSGQYLSVPSSVGFIVLFGVAVLNGVVLVSSIAQWRRDGLSTSEAILRGCGDRLRPVLMTASIAVFSLTPMLFATGPGSEIQRPLATVVVGGLITSTLLTLFVIPAMFGWFEKKQKA